MTAEMSHSVKVTHIGINTAVITAQQTMTTVYTTKQHTKQKHTYNVITAQQTTSVHYDYCIYTCTTKEHT